jgi:hypothetical protein
VYAQQNQFLSEYELRTEKKEGAKAVRRQTPVFCKPYRPNKITALGRNDEGDSFEESIFRRIFGRKDLSLIRISDISHAWKYHS